MKVNVWFARVYTSVFLPSEPPDPKRSDSCSSSILSVHPPVLQLSECNARPSLSRAAATPPSLTSPIPFFTCFPARLLRGIVFLFCEERLPEMDALFQQEELVEALAGAFPEGLRLARGTRGKTVKLQRNAGAVSRYYRAAATGAHAHMLVLLVCTGVFYTAELLLNSYPNREPKR